MINDLISLFIMFYIFISSNISIFIREQNFFLFFFTPITTTIFIFLIRSYNFQNTNTEHRLQWEKWVSDNRNDQSQLGNCLEHGHEIKMLLPGPAVECDCRSIALSNWASLCNWSASHIVDRQSARFVHSRARVVLPFAWLEKWLLS